MNIAATLSIVGGAIGILVGANRFHAFLSQGSIISQTDIYITIALVGVCFYLFLSLKKEKTERKKAIIEARKKMSKEYHAAINEQVNILENAILNLKESVDNIRTATRDINSKLIDVASGNITKG